MIKLNFYLTHKNNHFLKKKFTIFLSIHEWDEWDDDFKSDFLIKHKDIYESMFPDYICYFDLI